MVPGRAANVHGLEYAAARGVPQHSKGSGREKGVRGSSTQMNSLQEHQVGIFSPHVHAGTVRRSAEPS